MSDIDEAVRDILIEMGEVQEHNREISEGVKTGKIIPNPMTGAIAAIKQAFTDAGYTKGKNLDEVYRLLEEEVKTRMTGQEAFERLEKAGLLGHDLEIAREALGAAD